MKFVLFHGAFGSPDGNWFPQLKEKLEAIDQQVIAPQFPVENWDDVTKNGSNVYPENQGLDNWLTVFEPIAKTIKKNEKICFVGHSLGSVFILHAVKTFDLQLDSAIFVSPFLTRLNRVWQIDVVNASFYKFDFDFVAIRKLIPVSYSIYAKDDPYVPIESAREFAKSMKSEIIESESGMHFNSESQCTSFPLVLELCKTRLHGGNTQNYFSVV